MAQPHEVLGVAANADEATINAAFRSAAKKFHPDLNNGDPSGIRRLRRLIAARDFLTNRRWRPSAGPKIRYQLPSFRKDRIGRSVILTFVLTGACALLFLPAFVSDPDANPPKVSVVRKTRLSPKPSVLRVEAGVPVDTGVPDAESAEVKAIRDLREVPGYSPMDAEAAADPLSQNGAKHPAISAAAGFRRAVKGAATLISKTFQRIASKL